MSESKLSTKIQGVKGGNLSYKEQNGRVVLFLDSSENNIIADAFAGCGASYKRREQTQIVIAKGSEMFTFNSFDDLFNHLQKTI